MTERSFEKFSQRLSKIGLLDGVKKRSLTHNVSLRELYEGPRAPSIIAARRAVYKWLMKSKSINEIARLFDRSTNGVWKLTRES